MAWTEADIPDLSGKVAVVTGANSGLGYESARALSRAGAHVVMAARNVTKVGEAREKILKQNPGASLVTIELDLGSITSVRTAAESIGSQHGAIDILLNNAGIMATPEGRTANRNSQTTISQSAFSASFKAAGWRLRA